MTTEAFLDAENARAAASRLLSTAVHYAQCSVLDETPDLCDCGAQEDVVALVEHIRASDAFARAVLALEERGGNEYDDGYSEAVRDIRATAALMLREPS